MEVVLVRWPLEAERSAALTAAGMPQLLLVETDQAPPEIDDCLQDWIRLPAPEGDLWARMASLSSRSRAHAVGVPAMDSDDVLRFRSGWVSLPPVEARLTRLLVEQYRDVVGRDSLSRAAWPRQRPGRNALDVHMVRLRRRLAPVGLAIRTVRARGYLLEPAGSDHGFPRRTSTHGGGDTLPA